VLKVVALTQAEVI